jgi:hypothetical protein
VLAFTICSVAVIVCGFVYGWILIDCQPNILLLTNLQSFGERLDTQENSYFPSPFSSLGWLCSTDDNWGSSGMGAAGLALLPSSYLESRAGGQSGSFSMCFQPHASLFLWFLTLSLCSVERWSWPLGWFLLCTSRLELFQCFFFFLQHWGLNSGPSAC